MLTPTLAKSKKKNENKSCLEFLRYLDVFGVIFNFRVGQEERFQSTIGGMTLIGFIILAIVLYINCIINYFHYPTYSSNYFEKQLNFSNPNDFLNLTEEHFDYAIWIDYDEKEYTNDTFIIYGTLVELSEKKNLTKTKSIINRINCNFTKFEGNKNITNKTKDAFSKMACFDNSNFKIGGSRFFTEYSYAEVQIKINKSKNLTEISNKIMSSPPEFHLLYPNLLVDNKDFSYSYPRLNSVADTLHTKNKKVFDTFVVRNIYEDDLNIFFQQQNKYTYTKYEKTDFRVTQLDLNTSNDLVLASIHIRASDLAKVNQKYISKISAVLLNQMTQVVNYFAFIKVIMSLINIKQAKSILSKNILNSDIDLIKQMKIILSSNINKEMVNFKNKEADGSMIEESNIKEIERKSNELDSKEINNKNNSNSSDLDLKYLSEFKQNIKLSDRPMTEQYNKVKFPEKRERNFSTFTENDFTNKIIQSKRENELCELNLSRCKIDDKNSSKIFRGKIKKKENHFREIEKILDIEFYLRKIQEIDMFKYLLFDKNATQLFNFLGGKINISGESEYFLDYNNVKNHEIIKKSYLEIKSSQSNPIISKLTSLFEDYINEA